MDTHLKNIILVGNTGGIGHAILHKLIADPAVSSILTLSRSEEITNHSKIIKSIYFDYEKSETLLNIPNEIPKNIAWNRIIIATGFLSDDRMMPEKSLREIEIEKLERIFRINCSGPSLLLSRLIPLTDIKNKLICVAFSARVSSISDNKIGGWYAYRSAKAALNMMIKNTAIETARKNPNAIIIGYHPGTVDTNLSKPFQKNVLPEKLFKAPYTADCLINLMEKITPYDSGKIFSYDGTEILP